MQSIDQSLSHPVREVATSCFVKHYQPCFDNMCQPLDYIVKHTEFLQPVLYGESKHLAEPFSSPCQRFHFISKLSLSMSAETLDLAVQAEWEQNCNLFYSNFF